MAFEMKGGRKERDVKTERNKMSLNNKHCMRMPAFMWYWKLYKLCLKCCNRPITNVYKYGKWSSEIQPRFHLYFTYCRNTVKPCFLLLFFLKSHPFPPFKNIIHYFANTEIYIIFTYQGSLPDTGPYVSMVLLWR